MPAHAVGGQLQEFRNRFQVPVHTVAAYRDAFRLLLQFASERLSRAPSELSIADLDASFLGKFLDYLEEVRGNCRYHSMSLRVAKQWRKS